VSARDGIENTLYHYAWGFDFDDIEMLADCFCVDADVTFPNGHRTLDRAGAREELNRRREAHRQAGTSAWHVITNVMISDETPTEARARSFYTFLVGAPGGKELRLTSVGYYDDWFANEDGTWRIKRRRVEPGASNR
jgi:hypothetical protein